MPPFDDLIKDLTPVRPMTVKPVLYGAGIGLALALIYVAMRMGYRPEIRGLMAGVMPPDWMTLAKPLIFVAVGLSALWAMTGLHRPDGALRRERLWPVAGLLVAVLFGMAFDMMTKGPQEMNARLHDPMMVCFTTILGGGIVGFGVLWALWLRRAAPADPALLAALSGLMCSSLMAAAYALHCDRDAPVYILAYYGGSVALLTGLCAAASRWLMRW